MSTGNSQEPSPELIRLDQIDLTTFKPKTTTRSLRWLLSRTGYYTIVYIPACFRVFWTLILLAFGLFLIPGLGDRVYKDLSLIWPFGGILFYVYLTLLFITVLLKIFINVHRKGIQVIASSLLDNVLLHPTAKSLVEVASYTRYRFFRTIQRELTTDESLAFWIYDQSHDWKRFFLIRSPLFVMNVFVLRSWISTMKTTKTGLPFMAPDIVLVWMAFMVSVQIATFSFECLWKIVATASYLFWFHWKLKNKAKYSLRGYLGTRINRHARRLLSTSRDVTDQFQDVTSLTSARIRDLESQRNNNYYHEAPSNCNRNTNDGRIQNYEHHGMNSYNYLRYDERELESERRTDELYGNDCSPLTAITHVNPFRWTGITPPQTEPMVFVDLPIESPLSSLKNDSALRYSNNDE